MNTQHKTLEKMRRYLITYLLFLIPFVVGLTILAYLFTRSGYALIILILLAVPFFLLWIVIGRKGWWKSV